MKAIVNSRDMPRTSQLQVLPSSLRTAIRQRLLRDIGAVDRRIIVGRDQLKARFLEKTLDHPTEGRVLVANMGGNLFPREGVILQDEIGPLVDRTLDAVWSRAEYHVAEKEFAAGLQRVEDARHCHRLPEIRQLMQRVLADDQIEAIWRVGEAQESGRLRLHLNASVRGMHLDEFQHRRRDIDRLYVRAHLGSLAGKNAGAAADVGHAPTRLDVEPHQRGPRTFRIVALLLVIARRLVFGREIDPDLTTIVVVPVARKHRHVPSVPRTMAATPVRDTSTRPSGFISSTN